VTKPSTETANLIAYQVIVQKDEPVHPANRQLE
jgi:hypothetical protein